MRRRLVADPWREARREGWHHTLLKWTRRDDHRSAADLAATLRRCNERVALPFKAIDPFTERDGNVEGWVASGIAGHLQDG